MTSQTNENDLFNKENFERGLQNRRKVVGDTYVDGALKAGSTELAWPNQQLVTE